MPALHKIFRTETAYTYYLMQSVGRPRKGGAPATPKLHVAGNCKAYKLIVYDRTQLSAKWMCQT